MSALRWGALCVVMSLALVPAGIPTTARTIGTTRSTTEIRAHGVALSLTLARRSYPQDALVRVTVRLQNVSQRTLQIGWSGAPACGRFGPGVQVTDASNQVLYPPAIDWSLTSCGKVALPRPLRPDGAMHRTLFAILRGPRVQAVVSVGRSSVEVATPPLTVTLVPEAAPHLTLTTTAPSEIEVAPATPRQRGIFYYVTSVHCLTKSGGSGWGFPRFGRGAVDHDGVFRVPSGCEPPTLWSFAGGWVNHPAVTINHVQPISPDTL